MKILGAIAALAMTVGLAACGTPVSQGTAKPKPISGWDGSRISTI